MTTIHNAYINALLADAAYVGQFTPGSTENNLENKLSARMRERLLPHVAAAVKEWLELRTQAI